MDLPTKLRVDDFPGADYAERWKAFLDGIYGVFLDSVVNGGLTFQGLPIKCRWYEPFDNKHASFWHLMSEGRVEADRTPDLDRCERIPWIAWVIQNADNPEHVRSWETERSTNRGLRTRLPLWLFSEDYVVILERRETF